MIVDDPYMVRVEALTQLGATGDAFRDLAKAWMPKGESPSLRDLFAAFALMGHIANANDQIDRDTRVSSCWDYARE